MKTKTGNKPAYYIGFLLILVFCSPGDLMAQKYWSLQECIDQAIQNNITVKQREMNSETVKADLLQSKMSVAPSLNGQATNNYNTGFAINPATNAAQDNVTFRSNSIALSANMTLFNGFQQSNNIRLQQSNVKASEEDVESTKNTIRLNVANAYLQVLMNSELLERNRLQVTSTRQQISRQQKLVELGAANRVKLLQLKAQVSNEELQIVNGENQLNQSYLTLWQLMNIDLDTSSRVVKPEFDIRQIENEPRSASQIYTEYVTKSPDVRAAQFRARSADISRYVALGGRTVRITANASINSFYSTQTIRPVGTPIYTPQIIGYDVNGQAVSTLYPTFNYETTPFNDQFNRNLGKTLGFTLFVPIFNGWQVNTNVQKAKINQATSHLNESQVQKDLYKTITQARQDFTASQKNYEANENSFEANKEAFSLAEGQFGLGALSTTDYLNTKNEFLKALALFVQAKYELVFRRKVLDFYLGKSL